MSLQTDSAALAKSVLTNFATAIDNSIKGVAADVAPLVGDAATFGIDYLENHVGGEAGVFLKAAFGLGGATVVADLSTALTVPVASGLTVAQGRIDADLAALEAKL